MSGRTLPRLLLLALLLSLIACWFLFDLGQYFDLATLQQSRADFVRSYQEHQAFFVLAYFALYVAVTALSLPAATVLTLVGGAIFGFTLGSVVISFASTLGATLACAASRFVLRDWVQGRFGEKIRAINSGMEREGAFYLFSLRLIPVFPFFAINLGMGLTPMPLRTFYWVSQLGMLPGTLVYVNAGTELGGLTSLSGILSPSLILSFALLGIFPLAAKKILGWYKSRRHSRGDEI